MVTADFPTEESGDIKVIRIVPTFQVQPLCGPEKESCVANQTLRDKSCLLPCSGLYADIEDDSLKQTTQDFEQNMKKGNMRCILPILS